MFTVIILSSICSIDEDMYWIDEEPRTVRFCVTVREPVIV